MTTIMQMERKITIKQSKMNIAKLQRQAWAPKKMWIPFAEVGSPRFADFFQYVDQFC